MRQDNATLLCHCRTSGLHTYGSHFRSLLDRHVAIDTLIDFGLRSSLTTYGGVAVADYTVDQNVARFGSMSDAIETAMVAPSSRAA